MSFSAQNNLGKGGFGSVYKASYNGQTVAVKIFSQSVASMNNTTPSQLIRQEVFHNNPPFQVVPKANMLLIINNEVNV